jgi:hypothetical protein
VGCPVPLKASLVIKRRLFIFGFVCQHARSFSSLDWTDRMRSLIHVALSLSIGAASLAHAQSTAPVERPTTTFPYTPGLDVTSMDRSATRASIFTSTPAAAG